MLCSYEQDKAIRHSFSLENDEYDFDWDDGYREPTDQELEEMSLNYEGKYLQYPIIKEMRAPLLFPNSIKDDKYPIKMESLEVSSFFKNKKQKENCDKDVIEQKKDVIEQKKDVIEQKKDEIKEENKKIEVKNIKYCSDDESSEDEDVVLFKLVKKIDKKKDIKKVKKIKENHLKEERSKVFEILSDKSKINDKLKFTKMCKYIQEGKSCPHDDCRFAHRKEQLTIGECLFSNCRFVKKNIDGTLENVSKTKICFYLHKKMDEHLDNYYRRVGVVLDNKIRKIEI
jgi:hypothetical protein